MKLTDIKNISIKWKLIVLCVLLVSLPVILVGNATINVDSISNLEKNTQIAHYDAVVLFETPEGGFKGEMLAHHKNMHTSEWTLDWHFVLQGFGAFEGQTLQIRLNGPYPGSLATGYLLKPSS